MFTVDGIVSKLQHCTLDGAALIINGFGFTVTHGMKLVYDI